MDFSAMQKNARERLQGYCRVCPTCDGRACAGEVPGMGGVGTGRAFMANVEALAACRFHMRTIHSVKMPDTSIRLWGEQLGLPVLAAPMTGTPYNMGGKMTEEAFIEEIVAGALVAGTIGMTGDGADPAMYDSGLRSGAGHPRKTVAIIKPRSQQEVIRYIRKAEAAGVLAVGMDIDGAGLVTMAMKGQPVSPKTVEEVREIVASTKLPFVLKGVMTPDEADLAVAAGASAIVVSNHGGRVLDSTPGTAEVLPLIAERVKGRIALLADGGVRAGGDVLKMLALGADAVLVGRPLVIGAFGYGRDGVAMVLNRMKAELVQAMLLTGTADVKQVSRTILAAKPMGGVG